MLDTDLERGDAGLGQKRHGLQMMCSEAQGLVDSQINWPLERREGQSLDSRPAVGFNQGRTNCGIMGASERISYSFSSQKLN